MPPRPRRRRPVTFATAVGALAFIMPGLALAKYYVRTRDHWLVGYSFLISAVTFLFYGHDKLQAKHMNYRTPEKYLHVLAMMGGWPGALIGQHYFRHKTRKTAFLIPFWGIVLGWQFLLFVLYFGVI
ncbi:DUF1294-domain-containing protein [Amniculicola lignicola CBS 123094]|uniref:DUF1294-domain-containing protein n=1 Tax=Amniculicola lignicola CBS 123094 TaxID=1392246 RepID=A0A6A5W928_9PLEO|nr:DUF1294-domain-containing protein [Amniculicola lignicola CBS 123094]